MKLIVGLGNIGSRYARTRHNLGFMIIDEFASQTGAEKWHEEVKFRALISKIGTGESAIILAKPTTMMNLSGGTVQKLMHYYKVDLSNVLIIHDEVDHQLGKIQLKQGGGSAGHNGVQSIIDTCGNDFWRLRGGVANDLIREIIPTVDFVLQDFTQGEQAELETMIAGGVEWVKGWAA